MGEQGERWSHTRGPWANLVLFLKGAEAIEAARRGSDGEMEFRVVLVAGSPLVHQGAAGDSQNVLGLWRCLRTQRQGSTGRSGSEQPDEGDGGATNETPRHRRQRRGRVWDTKVDTTHCLNGPPRR